MAVKGKKKVAKKMTKKTVKAKKVTVKRASVKSAKKPLKKTAKQSKQAKTKKKVQKTAPQRTAKKTKPIQAKKAVIAVKKAKPAKTVAKKIIKPKNPIQASRQTQTVLRKPAAKPQARKPVAPTMRPKKPPMTTHTYAAVEVQTAIEEAIPKKPTTLLGALEFTPYQPAANEAYMNDRQREHFRNILNAWKQQLMQDVDTTVGHLKEEAVFYADPVDRASQEEGFNLELRTRDRERRLIKKIEQSLDLLNKSDYGFCEDCGAEIGIRRLEARPTAVKCIDCKTFQEIREKQLGG